MGVLVLRGGFLGILTMGDGRLRVDQFTGIPSAAKR
jgi:hypothetical protein